MRSEKQKLLWSPESEQDLIEIWSGGAIRFSPQVADKQLRNIHAAARRLCFAPYTGRERPDLRQGIREIVVYPSVMFYRVTEDAVEVVRVVDGRRNLAALFGSD